MLLYHRTIALLGPHIRAGWNGKRAAQVSVGIAATRPVSWTHVGSEWLASVDFDATAAFHSSVGQSTAGVVSCYARLLFVFAGPDRIDVFAAFLRAVSLRATFLEAA